MLALLVTTPGFHLDAYTALIEQLRREGHRIEVVDFPCVGQDTARLVTSIEQHAPSEPYVIVSHGVGATLALMARPKRAPDKYVLLAPVLDVVGVASTRWAASTKLPVPLRLAALTWRERSLAELLLHEVPALDCAPAPFAREVQGWVRTESVPVSLTTVPAPVWLGVSLGDDVATVEAVVPASREIPERELVRFGVNRLDPKDFGHGELLTHPIPVRVAVDAIR